MRMDHDDCISTRNQNIVPIRANAHNNQVSLGLVCNVESEWLIEIFKES